MNSKELQQLFSNIYDNKNIDIKNKNIIIEDILHIDYDLKELMLLEKKRLGFNENQLVFISAGDFAKFYWCQMQTYFSLIEHEVDKFSGYLQDKIEYSIKLGKLKKIPQNKQELLEIGDEIILEDIFKLLKTEDFQNLINKEKIDTAKKELETSKVPIERGYFLETIYSKKLPQIHWVFKYNNFIFTCAPDGIGEDYVYEFKSSKNRFFSKFSIQKAKLQADIYGICFNKSKKIIDQLIQNEDNKIETIYEDVNLNRVNNVISIINSIILGNLPKPPKEKFKCLSCEYKNKCKIRLKPNKLLK